MGLSPSQPNPPLQYYIMVLESIMGQERSYDSLPNFTAVDCLRSPLLSSL